MRTFLAMICIACTADAPMGSPVTDTTSPSRWPACDATATSQTISFVHVNDMHGAFNPLPDFPGESPLSRAVGYYKAVLRDNPYTVWSDGGDDFEKGSVVEDLSGGRATTELIQGMGFDVRSMGNHDFAWGTEVTLAHTLDARAHVLATNTDYVGDDPAAWGAVKHVVLEVGCVKVGMFSLNTRPYGGDGGQYDGSYLPGVVENTYDWPTEAKAAADVLVEQGADVIVALNHVGMSGEAVIAGAEPRIALSLASHSHTFTAEPVLVGDTRVVQAGSSSNFVIRTDITFDLQGQRPAITDWAFSSQPNVPSALPVDDAMESVVTDVFTRWAPDLWDPVGQVGTDLTDLETAAVMGRAGIDLGQADAAVFDADYLARPLREGGVNVQHFFSLVAHEREPPGTPTWASFWRVDVSGTDLQATRDALTGSQVWQGPEILDPSRTYRLVVAKRVAEYPELFLAGLPRFTGLTLVGEPWRVLRDYAIARQADCRYVDADEAIPGC